MIGFVGCAYHLEHCRANDAVWPKWKWADSPTGWQRFPLSREGEGVAMPVLIDSVNDGFRRLRSPFRTSNIQPRGLAQAEVGRFAERLATIPPLPRRGGEGRGEGQNFPDPTFSKTDVEVLEVTIPSGLTVRPGPSRSEVIRSNPNQTFFNHAESAFALDHRRRARIADSIDRRHRNHIGRCARNRE